MCKKLGISNISLNAVRAFLYTRNANISLSLSRSRNAAKFEHPEKCFAGPQIEFQMPQLKRIIVFFLYLLENYL